jgi:hypothetical protein
MNKAVIIGIAVFAIVIGILVVLSLDTFSNLKDDDLSSEPILGNGEDNLGNEQKPPGRNLSIELDEKMGLSAP